MRLARRRTKRLVRAMAMGTGCPKGRRDVKYRGSIRARIVTLGTTFRIRGATSEARTCPKSAVACRVYVEGANRQALRSILDAREFRGTNVRTGFIEGRNMALGDANARTLVPRVTPKRTFTLCTAIAIPRCVTDRRLVGRMVIASSRANARTVASGTGMRLGRASGVIAIAPRPTSLTSRDCKCSSGSKDTCAATSGPHAKSRARATLCVMLKVFTVVSKIDTFYCEGAGGRRG